MRWLKPIKIGFCVLLYGFSVNAQAQYVSDFKALIMSVDPNFKINALPQNYIDYMHIKPFLKDLGFQCYRSLYDHYSQEKTLEVLDLKNSAISLKDYSHYFPLEAFISRQNNISLGQKENNLAIEGLKNNVFYHYFFKSGVNSELPELSQLLQSYGLDENVFLDTEQSIAMIDQTLFYTRTSVNRFGRGVFYNSSDASVVSGVLYLAAGPYSSASFGDSMLSLYIDPQAKVIDLRKSLIHHSVLLWKLKMQKNYPDIYQACEQENPMFLHNVFLLSLQDSGIDLIHYSDKDWFQLLSPKSIQTVTVNYFNQENPQAHRINTVLEALGRESEIIQLKEIHGQTLKEMDFQTLSKD